MDLSGDTDELLRSLPAPAGLPSRSGLVYQRLRTLILRGVLEPGQRIDQDELSRQLAVSRTPLRQALLMLDADGLIEHRPYHGAAVTPLSEAALRDIYASRQAMEGMLAGEAARQASATPSAEPPRDALATAEGLLVRQARAVADTAADPDARTAEMDFVELDRAFHLAIFRLSQFSTALEIVERLLDLSERYARVYAQHASGRQQSVQEHRQILDACRGGRVDEARRLSEQHTVRGRQLLEQLVSQSLT